MDTVNFIDMRSDTVTRPDEAMRAAMAGAPVGDDQFGEDPTINLLQEKVAAMLGKPASLWFPSGTMANQVALKLLTQPGDDVIVSRESHAIWHEGGGSGALAGVQFTEVGAAGVFTADQFEAAIKPRDHPMYPPSTLVEVENTHNRMGGIVFLHQQAQKICEVARTHGLASYLDGARLWNAALVLEESPATLCQPFDLVMVSLSKGLGAPGGSMLAGDAAQMKKALRYRRMLGGAMRQVGIFAAAGIYALDHHMAGLADDHANARRVAGILAQSPDLSIDPGAVDTNILVFRTTGADPQAPNAHEIVRQAAARGVQVFAFDPATIRAVTHRDVSAGQCEQAAQILVECAAARA